MVAKFSSSTLIAEQFDWTPSMIVRRETSMGHNMEIYFNALWITSACGGTLPPVAALGS